MNGWPERLEIHTRIDESEEQRAYDAMLEFESELDDLLAGLGAAEGNEVSEGEWITYVECTDAEVALNRLHPRLRRLGSDAVWVLKCSRVVVR